MHYKKHSCIITYRKYHGNYQFLLVKKNHSYEFLNIVLGKYKFDGEKIHINLNNLSNGEAYDLYTKDLITLYKRTFIKYTPIIILDRLRQKWVRLQLLFIKLYGATFYEHYKNKFKAKIMWVIPGGRLKKNEYPMDGAIREFREETGYNDVSVSENRYPSIIRKTYNDVPCKIYYYYGKINDFDKRISPNSDDTMICKWYSYKDIISSSKISDDTKKIVSNYYKQLSR